MDETIKKPSVIAIYLRVSSHQQDVELQRKELKDEIEKQGYVLFDEYVDEDVKGTTEHRKGLDRLLADARLGKFDTVLCYKLDRVARDVRLGLNVIHEIETEGGVKVNVLKEPTVNTGAPGYKMARYFILIGAEMEYESIKQRTRDAFKARTKANKWVSSIIPDGYSIDKTDKRYALVVNPERVPIIKRIFSMYIDDNMSARQIRDQLNREGIPSYKGRPWGKDTIQDKLSNPLYTGKLPINGKKLGPIHIFTCEPIISDERFEEAQAKKRERSSRSDRNKKREYIFGDYMWCASCGLELNCITSGANTIHENFHYGYRRPYGNEPKYKKRCPNGCGKISERTLVDALYEHMAKFIAHSSTEQIIDWLQNSKTKFVPDMMEELKMHEIRARELHGEYEKILRLYPRFIKSEEQLRKRLEAVETEIREEDGRIRLIKQNIVKQEEDSERLGRLAEFAEHIKANMRLSLNDMVLIFDKDMVETPVLDVDNQDIASKILFPTKKNFYQFKRDVVKGLLKFIKRIEVDFPDSPRRKQYVITDNPPEYKGLLYVVTKASGYLDGHLAFEPDPKRKKGRPKKNDNNGGSNNGGNTGEINSQLRVSERTQVR